MKASLSRKWADLEPGWVAMENQGFKQDAVAWSRGKTARVRGLQDRGKEGAGDSVTFKGWLLTYFSSGTHTILSTYANWIP